MIDVEDGREIVDSLLELVERSGGRLRKVRRSPASSLCS
jgi:hypothetical protein